MKRLNLPEGNWHLPEKTRVPNLPRSEQSWVQMLFLRITQKRAKTKQPLAVFQVLARLGNAFPRYLLFLQQILMKGKISRFDKELIILRVAWKLGCVYEWGHHLELAKDLDISDELIQSLTHAYSDLWSPKLLAYFNAIEDMLENRMLDDSHWNALRQHLSDDQMVEFCMLIGHYVMVAMTIHSTGVQLEPDYLN